MSKFMFFDFRCIECDHVWEAFVKPDVTPRCPECDGVTKRCISAPRVQLNPMDPDFQTSSDKWAKTNKQKTAQDKAFYKEHGVDKMHHSYGS